MLHCVLWEWQEGREGERERDDSDHVLPAWAVSSVYICITVDCRNMTWMILSYTYYVPCVCIIIVTVPLK